MVLVAGRASPRDHHALHPAHHHHHHRGSPALCGGEGPADPQTARSGPCHQACSRPCLEGREAVNERVSDRYVLVCACIERVGVVSMLHASKAFAKRKYAPADCARNARTACPTRGCWPHTPHALHIQSGGLRGWHVAKNRAYPQAIVQVQTDEGVYRGVVAPTPHLVVLTQPGLVLRMR